MNAWPPWLDTFRTQFAQRIEQDRMSHALLLAGPAGLGKRALLEWLVARLLCQSPAGEMACGGCHGCRLHEAGTHPDLVRVTRGVNREGRLRNEIVVDQVRILREQVTLSSQFGGWRITILDPADRLNAAAANALLKTLEEPGENTLLALVADQPWRLPATVRSRCQTVNFAPPDPQQALAWLQGQGVADCAVALAAAQGNPGRALSLVGAGALARREQVRRDLIALLSRKADVLATASQWKQDEPQERLIFAAEWLAEQTRAEARGETGPLRVKQDLWTWSGLFEQANQAREALRGPLRPDLVLLDFLSLRVSTTAVRPVRVNQR